MSRYTTQRKLAAIVFTDIVGYSLLSQRKESLALELREASTSIQPQSGARK